MTGDWEKRTRQYRKLWAKEPEFFHQTEQLLSEYKQYTIESKIWPHVTVYVAAPLLCEYISWVVQEAVRCGKKRLYFLARDGYFMKKVAEILCAAWNVDIECKYLYCSRYAWRGAVYHMNTEEALNYITLGGLEAGFQKMMQRAGLTKEEAVKVAKKLGYDVTSTRRFSVEERDRLRQKLSGCEQFMQLLKSHSEDKYESTMAYIAQEGLLDEMPYALVDSGWTGSLQKSLAMLLKSVGYETVLEGYYFGMYRQPEDKEAGIYHTYYFAPENQVRRKVYFNNNVFECIYSAPHGMTVAYEQRDEAWQPVLERKESPNKERLLQIEPLLLDYARLYASYRKNKEMQSGNWHKQAQKRLEQLVYLFMGTPTGKEAREYGDFVFCDDVIGEEKQLLATRLSKKELKNGFLLIKTKNKLGKKFGKKYGIGRESAWPEGSVAIVMGKNGFWHCALCEYVRVTIETLKNRR